jgi:hypothetical protein
MKTSETIIRSVVAAFVVIVVALIFGMLAVSALLSAVVGGRAYPAWSEVAVSLVTVLPSVAVAAVLLLIGLLLFSRIVGMPAHRRARAALGASAFGLIYGYQAVESVLVAGDVSAFSVLMGVIGVCAGAVASIAIPEKILPAWPTA